MTEQQAPPVFHNECLLEMAGCLGKFHVVLITCFAFNNMLVAFSDFGNTLWDYKPDYGCYVTDTNDTFSVKENSTVDNERLAKLFDNYISFAEEFEYVCSNEWKISVLTHTYEIGLILGSVIFGYCGDRIGRMLTYTTSCLLNIVGLFITIAMPSSVVVHHVARFFAGFTAASNFVMFYIMVAEYTKTRSRTYVLNLSIGVFYTIAGMAAPWIALAINTWKYYHVMLLILHVFTLFFTLMLPESFQLYAAQGYLYESLKSLKIMAKYNEKHIKDGVMEALRRYANIEILRTTNLNASNHLIRERKLRNRVAICFLKAFLVSLALTMTYKKIETSQFSMFLTATIIMCTNAPAACFTLFSDKLGRNLFSVSGLIYGSLYMTTSSIILVIFNVESDTRFMVFLLITAVTLKAVIISHYQETTEILPAEDRAMGLSIVYTGTAMGVVFGVELYKLRVLNPWFMEVCVGAGLLLAAFVVMFMPESHKKRLPVTLYEALNMRYSSHLNLDNKLHIGVYRIFEADLNNNNMGTVRYNSFSDEVEMRVVRGRSCLARRNNRNEAQLPSLPSEGFSSVPSDGFSSGPPATLPSIASGSPAEPQFGHLEQVTSFRNSYEPVYINMAPGRAESHAKPDHVCIQIDKDDEDPYQEMCYDGQREVVAEIDVHRDEEPEEKTGQTDEGND